jgi:hypothetical protein
MKTIKNACIIRSECTHYAYILLCKQTFQIPSVLVHAVTRHIWNCQELKYIIFRSALAPSSALIHILAHFQRTTCSQIYFRFSSYLLRKPHLFVIMTAIGWFIISIQSDLFWHRCLERQAFGTPRTLSPSKSIKGSNYVEFLKNKNVLLESKFGNTLFVENEQEHE